jgi:hypothetical protein
LRTASIGDPPQPVIPSDLLFVIPSGARDLLFVIPSGARDLLLSHPEDEQLAPDRTASVSAVVNVSSSLCVLSGKYAPNGAAEVVGA